MGGCLRRFDASHLSSQGFLTFPPEISSLQCRAGDVGRYFTQHTGGPSTKKQHIAALRRYFNLLVERHICTINPAIVAETERYQIVEGKTPDISAADIRTLMDSIDITDIVGLRDRAALATMIYTAARAGAVAKLRRGDYIGRQGAKTLRFQEKGGQSREIAVRHDLEQFIDEYLAAARMLTADKNTRLFRPVLRREKNLREWTPATKRKKEQGTFTPNDMCRMAK